MPAKRLPGRVVVTLRLPKPLVRAIDQKALVARAERGAKWSRNDEVVQLLSDAVEGKQ